MPLFQIETNTTGREVYLIDAEDEDTARGVLWYDAPKPVVTEVLSFEIESITEGR